MTGIQYLTDDKGRKRAVHTEAVRPLSLRLLAQHSKDLRFRCCQLDIVRYAEKEWKRPSPENA